MWYFLLVSRIRDWFLRRIFLYVCYRCGVVSIRNYKDQGENYCIECIRAFDKGAKTDDGKP